MLRKFLYLICAFYTLTGSASDGIWLLVDTNALKIEVKKGEQTVDIIEGIAIGQSGAGQKTHRGDNITPYGEYRIGWVGQKSTFHRFFGLNYPSVQDADNGLRKGIIDRYTYSDIINAHMYHHVPPQNTPLGGRIGIHGLGRASEKIHHSMNWTHGCIALTNKQIDHLSQWVYTGTIVRIK
ncbi:MAG: L,D-transpeptidase [Methylococcaceae bacterium]|nr:L,D-transpeptidase [Methylococcaceae bacterium]